MTIKLAM